MAHKVVIRGNELLRLNKIWAEVIRGYMLIKVICFRGFRIYMLNGFWSKEL